MQMSERGVEADIPLLEAKGLCFSYGRGQRPALDGVDFCIRSGEKVALLGENGSGKTSLLLALAGLLPALSGEICFQGRPWSGRPPGDWPSKVGLVFQEAEQQILATTVLSEVGFGPANMGMRGVNLDRRVEAAMEAADIGHLAHRPPHRISGGEKKRVTLASVLAMQPRVLLLDEPYANLDPRQSARIEGMLDEGCKEGMAVLVSMHDVDRAYAWADRILIFFQGRILAQGSPGRIFGRAELLERAGLSRPRLYGLWQALASRPGGSLWGKEPPGSPEELAARWPGGA